MLYCTAIAVIQKQVVIKILTTHFTFDRLRAFWLKGFQRETLGSPVRQL